jgi:hypothetical protein
VIAFVALFVRYVHRGYLGVLDCGDSYRLVDHGFYLRAPWNRVTFYPVRSREVRLRTSDEGPEAKVEFDVVLTLSVCRDSVVSLHEAYRGAYVEMLIAPLIVDVLRLRGDDSGGRGDVRVTDDVTDAIVERINSELGPRGINALRAWLRSYEVVIDPESDPTRQLR